MLMDKALIVQEVILQREIIDIVFNTSQPADATFSGNNFVGHDVFFILFLQHCKWPHGHTFLQE